MPLLLASVMHPMTISVWGDLVKNECERVSSLIESAIIIGITSLRVSNYNGLSLNLCFYMEFFSPSVCTSQCVYTLGTMLCG